MSTTTLLLVIAFFVLDTIIVCAVLFFVHGKKKSGNANTFGADTKESPFHSSTHSLNTSSFNSDEIVNLLRQGRKIEAIKIYRERTNLGLKEAKDAVEEIERQL